LDFERAGELRDALRHLETMEEPTVVLEVEGGDRDVVGYARDGADADRPLVVPHPASASRLFVLAPLADISPTLKAPGWQGTARELRDVQRRVEGEAAALCVGAWDEAALRWV
jgi:7,8-dihydro-6-hydroxymethylpterin-pyrophosphokinase